MANLLDQYSNPYQPEILGMDRQRKLAELLIAQGQQQPQGQMVGGRFIPVAPTQNLANLLNTAIGAYGMYKADEKAVDLANRIRQGEIDAFADFEKIRRGTPAVVENTEMAGPFTGNVPKPMLSRDVVPAVPPNLQAAYANLYANPRASQRMRDLAFSKITSDPEAFTLTEGGVRYERQPDGSLKKVAAGPEKFRAPLQTDTGTYIEYRDPVDPTKILARVPKSQMPTAGQVIERDNGTFLVDTRTGQTKPILNPQGEPLAPKLSPEQNKDILAINQQRATVNGAIADVQANKTAFGFGRGVAQNLPYGESIAGRFETPEQTQARAYVFNNVSAVIKERAGTAQSAQELTRLNSFLPATTDTADQIISKLKGFNQYLDDLEKGTRQPTSKPSASNAPTANAPAKPATPKVFSNQADLDKAIKQKKVEKGDKVTVNGVIGTIQ
jgi:hypothetical protein